MVQTRLMQHLLRRHFRNLITWVSESNAKRPNMKQPCNKVIF